jgi:lysozyme family protein
MGRFDQALQIILNSEGGYSNHSSDPGGETRYGITKEVAREHGYIGSMNVLPINTAADIYRKSYWDACKCDELPWPLNLYVFDSAVNQGVGAATKMLQKTLGTVQDGIIGDVTLRLANRGNAEDATIYLAERAMRYSDTRNFDVFGRGWLNRVFKLARHT